jgi:hypothetical protein
MTLELRKYKIFGLAIFDIVAGMIGMMILFVLLWKLHFNQLNILNFIIIAILLTINIF